LANRTEKPPLVIDARGKPRRFVRPALKTTPTTTHVPSIVIAPPTFGADQTERGILEEPSRAPTDCSTQILVGVKAAQRTYCPSPPQANSNQIPLNPSDHVKDEPYWAGEQENRNAPPMLPGANGALLATLPHTNIALRASSGPLGVLLNALANPSSFRNKENYGYSSVPPAKAGTPADPNAPPPLASDDAFKKALQATNDRKQSLYGRPLTPLTVSPTQVPRPEAAP
jgi:hypothetical protein